MDIDIAVSNDNVPFQLLQCRPVAAIDQRAILDIEDQLQCPFRGGSPGQHGTTKNQATVECRAADNGPIDPVHDIAQILRHLRTTGQIDGLAADVALRQAHHQLQCRCALSLGDFAIVRRKASMALEHVVLGNDHTADQPQMLLLRIQCETDPAVHPVIGPDVVEHVGQLHHEAAGIHLGQPGQLL